MPIGSCRRGIATLLGVSQVTLFSLGLRRTILILGFGGLPQIKSALEFRKYKFYFIQACICFKTKGQAHQLALKVNNFDRLYAVSHRISEIIQSVY
jgi:hypothetical protein